MGTLVGYNYRKAIVVDQTDDLGAVNYQMKMLVGESSGATGEQVDCGGHCLSTFNDLRFTSSDGSTLISYWIESLSGVTPNQLATVWVEVPVLDDAADTTIYMYYGKADASAVSSGADTFKMFNDGSSVAGWTAVALTGFSSPTWGVTSNKIRASSNTKVGYLYYDTVVDQDNYRFHAHITSSIGLTADNYQHGLVHQDTQANTSTGQAYWLDLAGYDKWVVRDNGTDLELSSADAGFDARNDNIYDLTVDDETHTLYVNGANKVHIHEVGWTPNYIGFYVYSPYAVARTVDFWNIFVANFTTNEPTWKSFGAEEALGSIIRSVPRIARIMLMSH